MLYLTRLMLNLRNREARIDLSDVQQLHRTILRAFPLAPDPDMVRQHFGILFRAEPVPDQPLVARVLVQSTYRPDWTHLTPGYLAPPPDARGNPATRSLDDDYERLRTGMTLRFRLRANPTQRIDRTNMAQDERWRGKRVELRDEQAQLAWLKRKATQGGFHLVDIHANPELADTRISPQANATGRRVDGQERSKMTFGVALFEGRLRIADVERFRQTLVEGIGSGKAYGFGLLSIATSSRGGA